MLFPEILSTNIANISASEISHHFKLLYLENNGARMIELSRKVIGDSCTVVDYLEEEEYRAVQEYLTLAKKE